MSALKSQKQMESNLPLTSPIYSAGSSPTGQIQNLILTIKMELRTAI